VTNSLDRRDVLRLAGVGLFSAAVAPLLTSCSVPSTNYGALLPADANGLALPPGFTSRVVATSGQTVPGTAFVWHPNPDGGACFATGDGGWIYVSNSESVATNRGGASMVRFDATGTIVEAATILSGTNANCAGGKTPWGRWLSCEEHNNGQVWECDPTGATAAVGRPAMGRVKHEAAAVDDVHHHVYLNEDQPDGALYRFAPTTWPDLSAGVLEVLTGDGAGALSWQVVPNPTGSPTATRYQVPTTKPFNGGEGICFAQGSIVFGTKGDNRVWSYNTNTIALTTIYDDNTSPGPDLTGVDNVESIVTDQGLIWFVAEDGGDMQVVAVNRSGETTPVCQLQGVTGSEITGPAFSPDGSRLYFSSQRNPGRTYEVSGPWKTGTT
jgi:secreted PhoX family phosphatase